MLALMSGLSHASDEQGNKALNKQVKQAQPSKGVKTNITEPPSMAFLEYLADLDEVNGELVGAIDMSDKDTQPATSKQKPKNVIQIKSTKQKQDKSGGEQ